MKRTYHGSCHCKAISFECEIDLMEGTRRCNCTFCFKTRMWKAFALGDSFRITEGQDFIKDYIPEKSSWPQGNIHHYFCKRCGVRSFSKGYLEDFGGWFHAVNVACLDDVSDEELTNAPIQFEDGLHDKWNDSPVHTSFL